MPSPTHCSESRSTEDIYLHTDDFAEKHLNLEDEDFPPSTAQVDYYRLWYKMTTKFADEKERLENLAKSKEEERLRKEQEMAKQKEIDDLKKKYGGKNILGHPDPEKRTLLRPGDRIRWFKKGIGSRPSDIPQPVDATIIEGYDMFKYHMSGLRRNVETDIKPHPTCDMTIGIQMKGTGDKDHWEFYNLGDCAIEAGTVINRLHEEIKNELEESKRDFLDAVPARFLGLVPGRRLAKQNTNRNQQQNDPSTNMNKMKRSTKKNKKREKKGLWNPEPTLSKVIGNKRKGAFSSSVTQYRAKKRKPNSYSFNSNKDLEFFDPSSRRGEKGLSDEMEELRDKGKLALMQAPDKKIRKDKQCSPFLHSFVEAPTIHPSVPQKKAEKMKKGPFQRKELTILDAFVDGKHPEDVDWDKLGAILQRKPIFLQKFYWSMLPTTSFRTQTRRVRCRNFNTSVGNKERIEAIQLARWTKKQANLLEELVDLAKVNEVDWDFVSAQIAGRDPQECEKKWKSLPKVMFVGFAQMSGSKELRRVRIRKRARLFLSTGLAVRDSGHGEEEELLEWQIKRPHRSVTNEREMGKTKGMDGELNPLVQWNSAVEISDTIAGFTSSFINLKKERKDNPTKQRKNKKTRSTREEEDILTDGKGKSSAEMFEGNCSSLASAKKRWSLQSKQEILTESGNIRNEHRRPKGRWSLLEELKLQEIVDRIGENWEEVSKQIDRRSQDSCKRKYELLRAINPAAEKEREKGNVYAKNNKRWENREIDELVSLREEGRTFVQISKDLHRTATACHKKFNSLHPEDRKDKWTQPRPNALAEGDIPTIEG